MTTDGNSPQPSEFSTGTADLFGGRTDGRPNRRGWRIELQGMDELPDGRSTHVRVTLVDAETGKRLAAQRAPFSWIRDVSTGGVAIVSMSEGDYS